MKILSGSMLKLIAVVTMFIDHTAHVFQDLPLLQYSLLTLGAREITAYYIMRKIGRLAFPIFCFLIMEGFLHTKNPRKYALRMFLFAILSEIPFDLMVGRSIYYPKTQNVYVTLLLGFLLIWCVEYIRTEGRKAMAMGLLAAGAIVIRGDYGLRGAVLPLLLYLLRTQPAAQAIVAYPLLSGGTAAFLAFLPINLYNGQRGFIRRKPLQIAFYLFYPAHILLLVLLKRWLMI